jgi:UDP-N-acetylmuramoylalanine--D-glutamate ligase
VGGARRVEFADADRLPAEPQIPGAHNRENAAAATAAARAAGAPDERIAEALRAFPGVPHRLEDVAEIGGVRFVNDSKATNAAAARRAIASYDEPLHVILGGLGKNESYAELAADIRARGARSYLIGTAADELAEALESPFERSGDLATAVRSAAEAAQPGAVVLLSPAAASYDQFENFEERGDEFRRLVEALR